MRVWVIGVVFLLGLLSSIAFAAKVRTSSGIGSLTLYATSSGAEPSGRVHYEAIFTDGTKFVQVIDFTLSQLTTADKLKLQDCQAFALSLAKANEELP